MSAPEVLRTREGRWGSREWYAQIVCPRCNLRAWIDRDQYEGRVSIFCECGYHETHDLKEDLHG